MGWLVNTTRRPLYPGKENRYPIYTRLGRLQDRSGRMRKISPPTGTPFPDCPVRTKLLYRLSQLLYRTKSLSVTISRSKQSMSKKCHSVIFPTSNKMSQHQFLYIQPNVTVSTSISNQMSQCKYFYIKLNVTVSNIVTSISNKIPVASSSVFSAKTVHLACVIRFNSVESGGWILAFQTSMLPHVEDRRLIF
jgi:hypothetical protein